MRCDKCNSRVCAEDIFTISLHAFNERTYQPLMDRELVTEPASMLDLCLVCVGDALRHWEKFVDAALLNVTGQRPEMISK